jgi:hypothetical protein
MMVVKILINYLYIKPILYIQLRRKLGLNMIEYGNPRIHDLLDSTFFSLWLINTKMGEG